MIIFFVLLCLSQSVRGATQTACTKTDTDTAVILLTCSSTQMIHVIKELYGQRTAEDDCRVVKDNSNAKAFSSDKQGLVVSCNGYNTCTEHTACGIHCNGTGKAFEITYECVEDSKNICSPLHQTGSLPSLYLHSPGFPLSAGEEEGRSCECSVSGTDLEVMVIQYRGNKGYLQINTTGDGHKTWTSFVNHFNRNIASNVNNVTTSFTKEGQSDTRLWVRLTGNITHISCNSTLSTTTTTTTASEEMTDAIETTTKSVSSSETTSSTYQTDSNGMTTESTSTASSDMSTGLDNLQSTEDQKITKDEESSTVMTVSVVCGVIIICLLLVIIGLLVYFKVIKPQRQRQKNTEETATYNGPDHDRTRDSNEPVNTYSDLVRYENQDNNYGKFHLYANPECCTEQTTGQ